MTLAVTGGWHDFGLMAGRDIPGKNWFIGVAATIDAFKIKKGSESNVCIQRKPF